MEHQQQQYKANNTHYSKFQTYLNASEYFLKQRNFEDCTKYAFKANEIDPNHIAPSQILAISNVLMLSSTINEDPNYYSILQLPLYTQDQQLIKTNFKNATNLLNPNQNLYPFASEAFKVVLRAWSVLSNQTQKTRFDNGLKKMEKGGSFGDTFWTVCPYCYYVYEFFKDYEDCCLRCQNEKCRRVFHGVPIVGPPPPPQVAEKGEYYCFGFTVLGTEGKSLWSPFVMKKKKNDEDEFIEISDDDEEEDGNGEKEKSLGVEEEFVKSNVGEVDKGCINMGGNFKKKRMNVSDDEANDGNGRKEKSLGVEEEFVKANGEEMNKGCHFKKKRMKVSDDEAEDGNGRKEKSLGVEEKFVKTNGENFKKKRIKMVAKSSNKVLGKGNKVDMNEIVYDDGENFVVEGNGDFDFGNVGEKSNENNVEFFVGDDDDIYVLLQEDLDMGAEDIGTLFS